MSEKWWQRQYVVCDVLCVVSTAIAAPGNANFTCWRNYRRLITRTRSPLSLSQWPFRVDPMSREK